MGAPDAAAVPVTAPSRDGGSITSAGELANAVATAVGCAFEVFTARAQSARSNLLGLSMSGLGGCRRQAAYRLAEVAPMDPAMAMSGENRTANMGTMIHDGLLPLLATVLGDSAQDETPVELRLTTSSGREIVIAGRSDMYWGQAQAVIDLKTATEHKINKVLGSGPQYSHRVQVAGYALACEQAGLKVRWIAWIYLDRALGEQYVVAEEFTDELRELVRDKVEELVNYSAAPDDAPRDGPGPGPRWANMQCNGCPWLRNCWGETAEPGIVGAQLAKIEDYGGMENVLVQYLTALRAEGEARESKEFWKDFLDGAKPGVYGKAQWGRARPPAPSIDKDACVELVRAAGMPVPMKQAPRGRLSVRWALPAQSTRDAGGES